jgi:hypothetical protein
MASANKFNSFVQSIGRKEQNLNSDTLNTMLTNTAPTASNVVNGDLTEISAGNGYSAGGTASGTNSYSQSSGTAKLLAADVVFTASGGSIGPFRYATIYNVTAGSASNRPLILYWDYGSSITLADTETFTVDYDGTNGVLTIA